MQKTILKALSIFMLIFFVMSMTGAAACSGSANCKSCSSSSCSSCSSSSCSTCSTCKTIAKPDSFNFSPSKKCGNVLSNDKGNGLKVTTTGSIKTAKGAKVYMKNNGYFCYSPAPCSKTGTFTDSFTYKAVNKDGKYGTAKVTIKYKCSSYSSCSSCSSCSRGSSCSSCSTCSK